jgi:DNA-binding protein YbaB
VIDNADWQRQIAENARRYQELQDRIARLSITEASRDGAVRVTVSATGVLTDLVLTERRPDLPLAQVGAQIMACVRRAQARIPDLMRQTMRDTVGPADPAAQLILADARQRFPAVPTESPMARPAVDELRIGEHHAERVPSPIHPARPTVTAPRATRRTDDEDWDDGPILEDLEGGR